MMTINERRAAKARQNKENALQDFLARKAKIDAMLARLQALSDEHFNADPDRIGWGHVGDLQHIEGQLKEICDCSFSEGEYAKE